MSSGTAKEFESGLWKLANESNAPPELRDQLLKMAREWMHAVIDEEDGTETPPPD